jgi:hypothetical protein
MIINGNENYVKENVQSRSRFEAVIDLQEVQDISYIG